MKKRYIKRRIGYRVGADISKNKRAEVFYRRALDKQIRAFLLSMKNRLKAVYPSVVAPAVATTMITTPAITSATMIKPAQEIVSVMNYYQTTGLALLLNNTEKIADKWLAITSKEADKSIRQSIYGVTKESITIEHNPDYDEDLRLIIRRNVGLIKNATQQTLTNVENIVFDAMTTGEGWKGIEEALKEQDEISANRIKRIARDQTAKANAAINYLQQKEAGIKYFEWRTAQDERVSTGKGGHKQLQGKIYRWDDEKNYPVIDSYGNKGLPAQRVNCRCVALPVVIFSGFHAKPNGDGTYEIVRDVSSKTNNAKIDRNGCYHDDLGKFARKDSLFGKSFSEYTGKPKEAIEKLLQEKEGYVPAAIYKQGIGHIDFVYGKGGITGYGLAHILEDHGEEIVKELPDLINDGVVDNSQVHLGRSFIYSNDKKVVISLNFLNEKKIWLLTAYTIDR